MQPARQTLFLHIAIFTYALRAADMTRRRASSLSRDAVYA